MVVRDGVLCYQDEGEVALWGVNYYPQSWEQYQSLKKLNIDPRRSIDGGADRNVGSAVTSRWLPTALAVVVTASKIRPRTCPGNNHRRRHLV